MTVFNNNTYAVYLEGNTLYIESRYHIITGIVYSDGRIAYDTYNVPNYLRRAISKAVKARR